MDRRKFIAATAAAVSLAGCTGTDDQGSTEGIQDSDGDGVIDSEDYAPQDPDVQEKSDIQGSGSTPTPSATPTKTPTETPEDIDAEDLGVDDLLESDTPDDSGDDGFDVDDPVETPTPTQSDFNYDDVHTVPGPGYYQVPLNTDDRALIEWAVTNRRSSEYDFDVFLFDDDEYQTYLDYANDRDSHRPEYYVEGTVQGITDSASRTITLPAGNYHLLVDNSDYGDAGDIGSEAARRVRIEIVAGPA